MHVELNGVGKTLGKHPTLQDISVELPAGEVVAVLGPNGAGKTTLLECLAGVRTLTRGEIRYDRAPFERDDLTLRRRLAFVPDAPELLGESPLDHAGLVLQLYRVPERDAVDRVLALLKRFELLPLAGAAVHSLSRGQAYKAGLIPLVAAEPRLLLLDEPFASGLDPAGLSELKAFAREVAGRGGTVVYTTQILEVVERFADRVCVLHQGRLLASGPLRELLADHQSADLEALFRQLREAP